MCVWGEGAKSRTLDLESLNENSHEVGNTSVRV